MIFGQIRVLLACGILALSSAEYARNSHFLNTVFGSKHTARLGLTTEDLDSMVADSVAASHSDKRTYLACAGLSTSATAAQKLKETVGEDNYHTVFSSRGKNLVCWATRATAAEADTLNAEPVMQSVVAIPKETKIHFNVLEFFNHQLDGEETTTSLGKRSPVSPSTAILKVEFGLGTGKGMEGIDMEAAVASWKGSRLRSASSKSYGAWKNVHAKTAQLLERQCDYSGLTVQTTKYTANIRGLASLTSSPQGLACLRSLVDAAASDSRVVRVLIAPEFRLLNENARAVTQSGVIGTQTFTDIGLTGLGQVVGVADSGVDDLSCFFIDSSGTQTPRSTASDPQTDSTRRKVIQYVKYADSRDDASGHGSHVCGSILGYSESSYADYYGMARDAKLAFFDVGVTNKDSLSIPSLYDYVFPAAASAGAHIHSNSWGSSLQACDETCLEIDQYVYDHPDFIVMVAAGNDGGYGYFSIGNPAMSKNCVAVGAAEEYHTETPTFNNDYMAYFSSIGPTFDNRIKPDVVAPGYFIYSAKSSSSGTSQTCAILEMAGTSMATPVTSGNAALIRQYFENSTFWSSVCNPSYTCDAFSPSGSLVKALLINSGQGMSKYDTQGNTLTLPSQNLGSPPDYFQGFGRILLANTLPVPGSADFDLFVLDSGSLTSDSTLQFSVTITDTTQPLRVTLSWYDPPTVAYTSKQVLHDLDLLVVAPDGTTTYWGNGVEYGDEYNNNEKVYIATPTTGTYEVKVHAYTLTESDTQSFSLVITSGGQVATNDAPTWSNTVADRTCADNEMMFNLVDLYGDSWGFGNYLYVADSNDEIVYLGIAADDYSQQSACLPDGCYSVQLTLSDVYQDYYNSKAEVVAEMASCHYLMYEGLQSYDFCVTNGACDYCNGAHTLNVVWNGLVTNKQDAIWIVYDYASGSATGEEYGGTGLSGTTTSICLDDGTYMIQVPLAPNGVALSVSECNIAELSKGEEACVTITDGVCTTFKCADDKNGAVANGMTSVSFQLMLGALLLALGFRQM